MNDARCEIRPAGAGDADAVADLAAELAQSFPLFRTRFHLSYPALFAAENACVLLVEEVLVRRQDRGHGIGRALMRAFEQWAARQGCGLIALVTRRAAPFYGALGYEESVYFRKVLDDVAID